MSTRRATHAGSWYLSDPRALGRELDDWLKNAAIQDGEGPHARAIIGPHAGYRYCGACGGHAYARIRPEKVKRGLHPGPVASRSPERLCAVRMHQVRHPFL